MKYSFSHILTFLFIFFALTGMVLVLAVSFYFYRLNIDRAVKERVVILRIVSDGISGPPWVTQAPVYPGFTEKLFRGVLEAPGVKFIRVVDPETGAVDISSDKRESGLKFGGLPPFKRAVSVREAVFRGEPVKEFSLQAKDGRGIWMGVSFEKIKRDTMLVSAGLGLGVFLMFGLGAFLVSAAFRRFAVIPFGLLMAGFGKLKKKDYGVRLGKSMVSETDSIFRSFNEMAAELEKSHAALEESKKALEVKVAARTRELEELNKSLDERVKQRTRELKKKLEELERFYRLTVGRERKMIELKKELRRARRQIKKMERELRRRV